MTPSRSATLLATWFGCGLLPGLPGTWGSMAALPLAWLLARTGGPAAVAAGALVLSAMGWWAAAVYARATGRDDPREVVIDEVAGQCLALVLTPPEPMAYLAGLAAFRAFDILKPGPVGWADRRIGGGLGIMADDILAGLAAAAVLAAWSWWR